ncbi:MAG TPA: SulP family inorganic anion transporter [Hyphomicrobiaceae bacterium]|nr:SulP family inorganic anion transporter [Hyphomicrobiaceae bacterium]
MQHEKPSRWPVPLAGLRGVTWADCPREIAAGITLAALIIPLNIGYAQVAGLPPTAGLYAAIIPLAVFALLTSSRHLITSPDASLTALISAALLGMSISDASMQLDYVLAMALVVGALFLLFWFFRLGFLANFLSRPVMAGFVSGLGLEVFIKQIIKILGTSHVESSGTLADAIHSAIAETVQTTGFFAELVGLIKMVPHANLYSVAIGLGALFSIRLLKRYAPSIPGALVALVVLTFIVSAFQLDQKGVSVLGEIPSGLPHLTFPTLPLSAFGEVLPGAIAIVAITLCEGLLLTRKYSRKHHYKANGDQVLFAFGAANVASAMTGAFLTTASPSRSAAMDAAGQRSQLPSLVAAATIALVMLFFTDLLAYLPNAALAGIVANAVINLIAVKEFRDLWRMRRAEFWIAGICFLSVLVLGPMQAVIIATLLSIVDVVGRASKPDTWLLEEAADGSHLIPVEPGKENNTSPFVVYRFGASLYFANANAFLEDIEAIIKSRTTPAEWFIFDAQAISDIDTTGAETLQLAFDMLTKQGSAIALSRANPPLKRQLAHFGLLAMIDESRIFWTNRHAVEAFRGKPA